jgi:hypothetical protein
MEAVTQVVYGLAATAMAFMLGTAWRRIKNASVNYRARRFWAPVMSKDLQLVIGRFRGLHQFEASGVIGAGDALAIANLQSYFTRIGFGGFRVSYNDQLGYGDASGEALRTNLILLGGPDANSLTYDVIKRLNLGIAFKEIDEGRPDELLEPRVFALRGAGDETKTQSPLARMARGLRRFASGSELRPWRTPVFVDLLHENEIYRPITNGDQILSDCGVIVRAPNPFEPSKNVVILCGGYGYGSWAAVQLVQTSDFVNRVPRGEATLECVFRLDVVRDTPQRPVICLMRPTPDGTAVLRAPDDISSAD